MVEMYTFLGKENVPFQNVIFLDLYTMCMLMDIHQWIKWLIYLVTVEYPGGDVQLPGQGQCPLPQRDFPLLSAGGPGRLHHRQPHAGHRSVNHLLATGQSATCWPQIVNHVLATCQSTTCWLQVSQPCAGHRSVHHMLATGQSATCWPVKHMLATGQSTTCWPGHRSVHQSWPGHRSVNHMLATGQSTTCWPQVSLLPCHCSGDHPKYTATVQFSSRWYLCAWKSPYRFHPISQKFPWHCLWNNANVYLTDDGPLSSFRGELSSTSPFYASLLSVSHPQHRSKKVQNSTAGRCWGGDLTGW